MYRIGIDLGGTNIAVGVVDDRHNIIAEASVPTGAFRPAEEMVADMCRAVRRVRLCGCRQELTMKKIRRTSFIFYLCFPILKQNLYE